MPYWRAHPIRLAALLGAAFGFLSVLVTEITGVLHGNHSAVMPLLTGHSSPVHLGVFQTAFILLIEVLASILVWALLFALPVAVAVGIFRLLRGKHPRA